MKKGIFQKLFISAKDAKKKFSALSPKQRSSIEKAWDIEHAYYSSTLEGSKLDRQEFEKLGEMVG